MDVIHSPQNQQVKLYRSLEKRKKRDELGLLPLEGIRLISDTLQRGVQPEVILLREDTDVREFPFLPVFFSVVPVLTVEKKLFDRTAFTDSPQGILAIVKKPEYTLDDVIRQEQALILIADRVQDPGNLGTMLRSCAAAGAGGVIILPGTVDPTNPKALRAAMGAYFVLPIVEAAVTDVLSKLKKHKIQLISAEADATLAYDHFDWKVPVAVAIGNEGSGLSDAVKLATEVSVSIPMENNVESLNASVAMSVLFFEAARQRRI